MKCNTQHNNKQHEGSIQNYATSFIASVKNKSLILSVIMISFIMLSVIMLSVIMLSVIMLSVICWVSLCWVSLCCVSLYWSSLCAKLMFPSFFLRIFHFVYHFRAIIYQVLIRTTQNVLFLSPYYFDKLDYFIFPNFSRNTLKRSSLEKVSTNLQILSVLSMIKLKKKCKFLYCLSVM